MAEIEAEVKKWGNSLGIRVPAALAQAEGIGPGDTVHVRIAKWTPPAPGSFGAGRAATNAYEAYLRTRRRRLLTEDKARDRRLGLR